MTTHDDQRAGLLLLAFGACVGALAAWVQGQDAGYDLRNYHWYTAWSLLHGRMLLDVAPAQLQGFFNPLIDLPYYLALSTLGPAAGTAVMGALHGLQLGCAGWIGLRLGVRGAPLVAALACAAWAPVFVAGVGTSSGDLLIGALVLAGLLAGLRGRLVLACVLTGAAVGLKPTAVAFAVALLVFARLRGGSWKRALGGLAAGWALTGGWWALALLARTGNPIFPMANQLFGSPWAAELHFGEMGYFPSGLGWLTLPWDMARGGAVSWFEEWRDARWLALWAVGAAWLVRSRRAAPDDGPTRALLAWAATAWIVWELGSSMARYLAPLEALAPMLIVIGLPAWRGRAAVAVGLLVAIALWAQPPDGGRAPFGPGPFGVELPPLPPGPSPVVVASGDGPSGYLAAHFPLHVRHARVFSSVVFYEDDTTLVRRAHALLATADPLLLLTGPDGDFAAEALAPMGLAPPTRCLPVRSRIDDGVLLCLLPRSPDGPRVNPP